MPINPIIEKDARIAGLEDALSDCRAELSAANSSREAATKARSALRTSQRESALLKRKMHHALKVTEQRMASSFHNTSEDEVNALVSLYASLVDEEDFELDEESDEIKPTRVDFLQEVETHLEDQGSSKGKLMLKSVKNEILARVKGKKRLRRERRDSISISVSSKDGGQAGVKRTSTEASDGGDTSRPRKGSSN